MGGCNWPFLSPFRFSRGNTVSDRSYKQRQGRKFRLELLESRRICPAPAESGLIMPRRVVPLARETIKGSLSGTATVVPITLSTGTVTAVSSGTLPVVGKVTLNSSDNYSVNKHHAIKYSHGSGIFADSSNDFIDVTFTGTGKVKGSSIFTFKLKGPISGGTGLFAGAKGKFTGTGSFDSATHAFSMNFKATLTQT